jgi:multisubunit Na+/H+ antiporter MnhF subunit
MALNFAIICLSLALGIGLFRVLRGPTWADRITALDFLNATIAVLVVIIALKTERTALLDVALLFSILGFLATIALAKFFLQGQVMKS